MLALIDATLIITIYHVLTDTKSEQAVFKSFL